MVDKVENAVDKRGKCVNNKLTLWKTTPQQLRRREAICMKKLLAICSIFFTVCTAFTSCGAEDAKYETDGTERTTYVEDKDERDNDSAGDYAKDAIDGAKDAGKDLVDGAGDAADDIIDGVDGKKEDDVTRERTSNEKTRRNRDR